MQVNYDPGQDWYENGMYAGGRPGACTSRNLNKTRMKSFTVEKAFNYLTFSGLRNAVQTKCYCLH